jgi:hypothetical protein
MPEDFEWHTDEDEGWGELSTEAAKSRGRFPRPPLVVVLLGLVAILAGLLIYRLVNRRTTQLTETIEAAVLTTHQLIQQADQIDDLDLFRSSLSGRSLAWSEIQEQLLVAGSLLDRPAFNLRAVSIPPENFDLERQETANIEVILTPDLASAEIHFDQPYLVEEGDQAGTTINLRQTAVYRLGERWLLAPPHKSFWGERESLGGNLLDVTYPERDKDVVERLAPDLDALVSDACRILADLNCPVLMQMRLHLEEEIETLLDMNRPASYLESGLDLHLPAPTLVGWPVDDAGYQALRRAYGLVLVTTLISHQASYPCCQQGPFYQALVDAQLNKLGLRRWPLTTSLQRQPERLSGSSLRSLNDVGLYWSSNQLSSPVEDIWPVYALIDFLNRLTNLSIAELQLRLTLTSDLPEYMSYWVWLQLVTDDLSTSRQDLERAWLAYNQETFFSGQEQGPDPPQQDLLLSCSRPNQTDPASLYRYNFLFDELVQEHQFEADEVFLIGVPGDEGAIVSERTSVGPGTRILLWQEGREQILVESPDDLVPLPFIESDNTERENILILNRRTRQYSLLLIQDCRSTSNCSEIALNGFPIWSPDGDSQLLLVSMGSYGYEGRFERPLSLGSVSGEIIGFGKEPFWLDERTAVFISPQGRELTAVDTDDLSQRTVFAMEDFAGALPPSHVSEMSDLVLEYASINPNEGDSLIVIATGMDNTYFFFADSRGNEIKLKHYAGDIKTPEFGTDFRFSPDGRWLVISTTNPANALSSITFYDTITNQAMTYPFHSRYDLPMHWQMDWSADGQWLSIIDNGYIRFIAPDFDDQRLIVPDDLTCTAAAWIN